MHRQTAQLEPLLFNTQHMNQSKKDVPSINQNSIHITTYPFLVGMFGFSIWLVSLIRTLSISAVYLPPCHSARSRRRSRRIHHPKNNPRPPGEGDRRIRWLRAVEEHFLTLLIRPDGHLLHGRRCSFARGFNCQVQQMMSREEYLNRCFHSST